MFNPRSLKGIPMFQKLKTIKMKAVSRGKYVCRFLASFASGGGISSLLHGRLSMMADRDAILFDAVNIDVNNTCNLRCRFCFNTFEDRHYYMTKETFQSILPIIPMVRDAEREGLGIYLSCLYEPTLSPHFFDFLELIPEEGRRKAFFTSNLNRPLKEEQIERMLRANLHHINISIETLKPDRYQEICSSVHFDSFRSNLDLLEKVYSGMQGPKPLLRFITMVLNCNRDEIIDIVKFCSKELHAYEHELRTPYISVYENMEWNRGQLMEADECRRLEEELAALHIAYVSDICPKDMLVTAGGPEQAEPGPESERNETAHGDPERDETVYCDPERDKVSVGESSKENETPQENDRLARTERALEEMRLCMNQEFYFLRFSASGVCRLNATGETFPVPPEGDPAAFYRKILTGQYRRRAQAFVWNFAPRPSRAKRIRMKVMFEELKANGEYLTLRGWCRAGADLPEPCMLTLSVRTGKGQENRFFTMEIPRPDLTGSGAGFYAVGFETCVDRTLLSSSPARLTFYLTSRQTLEDVWEYRYPHEIYWR